MDKQANQKTPGRQQKQTEQVQGYKMEEEKVVKNELMKPNANVNVSFYFLIIGFQLVFTFAGSISRRYYRS